MTIIDFVQMLKHLERVLKDKKEKIDKEIISEIKSAFIKECNKGWSKSEQYSHSLTYFLFLTMKLGLFFQDLFWFTINEIYTN
jgi:hypothetical protein